jgi:hypothetical protein
MSLRQGKYHIFDVIYHISSLLTVLNREYIRMYSQIYTVSKDIVEVK